MPPLHAEWPPPGGGGRGGHAGLLVCPPSARNIAGRVACLPRRRVCMVSCLLDVAPVSCRATCPSRGMCGPFGRVPPHAVYLSRHAPWLINLKPKYSTNKLFSLSHNFFRERRNANGFTVTVWCERGISVNERLSYHRVGPGQLHDAQTPAFSPRTGAQTI